MKATATDLGKLSPPGAPSADRPAGARDVVHIEGAAVTGDAEAPRRVRDDGQILKDIARAIREGHSPRDRQGSLSCAPADVSAGPIDPIAHKPAFAETPTPLPPKTPLAAPDPAYLAKLAHELKTPLSAIVAAAEIMRDERLGAMGNPRYLGYAADIHESASHALAVITRMLGAAAGPRTRADAAALEAVDLNDLTTRVVSGMMPLAKSRALTLDTDLEVALPSVLADPTGLRQILINLLSNALKFTPPGGDVRVVTGYLDTGGVFLVVRDTGHGMDSATLEKLTNGTAEAPLKRRAGGGYGIGLPLVMTLAEANHAALEIDSAPGKGTVVLLAFARDRLAHG
jgi:two-component system cell cycle sensor histidine kinase PleC